MATYGPKCPNHGVALTDCKNGVGICPVSGARFAYKADEQKQDVKWDINGKPIEQWDIESLDGDGG